MDYELLSYAFIAMSLGLMLGTVIGKKRIVVIPLILNIFAVWKIHFTKKKCIHTFQTLK